MNDSSSKVIDRKGALKSLIKRLHDGAEPEKVKEELKQILGAVTASEIAGIEEDLIKEGMPREEIQRLCNIHLAVFKEPLEREELLASPGHPVNILMEEHRLLLGFANELKSHVEELKQADGESFNERIAHLNRIGEYFRDSESHYLREENVLFPYLEKHGVTEPPAIMWTEHNRIREVKNSFYKLTDSNKSMTVQDLSNQLNEVASTLAEMLESHFFKENRILFPTAMKVIKADEWKDVRRQFDEIGYCSFTPKPPEYAVAVEKPELKVEADGMIQFETGSLSTMEIESVLNTLPVDITFVDKEDTVRYFSQSKHRIFARTKAVIGRKVQQCHPQASLPKVVQILEDFKNHRRDAAEFWINLKGRLIHIRYFAVRDRDQNYLGCLEITQDITDIQKLTGEKRLLD